MSEWHWRRKGPRRARNEKAVEAAIGALAAKFGNRLVTSQAVREQHGNTLTWIENQPPDAVVFPQSAEDVQDAVRICVQHKMPVIPFGTGTSLEGHINAPQGGVSIDFRDMNRILAVHAEDLDCVVEPGVTRKQLNEYLRDQGLFFPIDPGADASIGGMAATRASGTNAVRYGTMKDNVLSLKVVLANGETISTARRAKKSSAGYDLTRLFVGSEGTLGVITEVTVKLHGIPGGDFGRHLPVPVGGSRLQRRDRNHPVGHSGRAHRVARRGAGESLQCLFQADLPKRRCCFSNSTARRRASPSSRPGLAKFPRISAAGRSSGRPIPRSARELWQARHDAYWACVGLRPGAKAFATDVCVPLSRLAECVTETQRDIAEQQADRPDRRSRGRRELPRLGPARHGRSG